MRPLKILKNYRYFEAQEENERVILITRKHWLFLTAPFVTAFITALILVFFFKMVLARGMPITGQMPASATQSFLMIIVLYSILVAFSMWLMRYLNVLILTDKHMVDVSQKSFFARSVSTLELGNIEDVAIDKHGLWATILDYGNIKIQTAGEMPNFELKAISDPETVQRTIMEAKEAFRE